MVEFVGCNSTANLGYFFSFVPESFPLDVTPEKLQPEIEIPPGGNVYYKTPYKYLYEGILKKILEGISMPPSTWMQLPPK